MSDAVKWFIIGWFTVFVVKYAIVGLDDWNGVFHPGRVESSTGWERKFTKPLLQNIGA